MQFCAVCDNVLQMQIGEVHNTESAKSSAVPLTMYCKHCPYTLDVDQSQDKQESTTNTQQMFNPCMYRSNYSSNHPLYYATLVNKYTFDDPTLPRMKIPCPNEGCTSNTDSTCSSEVIFVRYDDQDMRHMYLCRHCRQCWYKNKQEETVLLFDFAKEKTQQQTPSQ